MQILITRTRELLVQVQLPTKPGPVAQLVEHQTENLGVAGSIPARTTIKSILLFMIKGITSAY